MQSALRIHTFSILLISAVFLSPVIAQIPNPGFEHWSYDSWDQLNPDGWTANNSAIYYTTIYRTTQSHSDSFAVKGSASWYRTFLMEPYLLTGFSINYRPATLTGYYQFQPVGSDTFFVQIQFYNKNTLIATNLLPISQQQSSYTQFSLELNYPTKDIPDSCYINFYINFTSAQVNTSTLSYFLLDNLAFSGVSAVPQNGHTLLNSYRLQQNYPNPFNPTTKIEFQIADKNLVTLKVFDIMGREVTTLVNEELDPGIYTRVFDGTGLSSGIYICRLESGGFIEVKKLVLQK